ncbi:MAG: zf-HC2 domain-containing protein [Caulobacterales bacterium]|nr:zf-HC2 domain-containing protein [Caulobacterales bacterium]
MARIIPLHGEEHREFEALLPWYVTGQLEPGEQARLEAHVAACAECQAEVTAQRRLEREVARLPLDVEHGWAQMRRQLAAEDARQEAATPASAAARIGRAVRAPWAGWAAAAAAAIAAVAGPLLVLQPQMQLAGEYHALSAPAAKRTGNLVVIFRPDAREADMRAAMKAAQARLVDGPTEADAYVLAVPAASRASALAALRGRPDVVLAEPMDLSATR